MKRTLWVAAGGGSLLVLIAVGFNAGCSKSSGFAIAPPMGTAIRLNTTTDSEIAVETLSNQSMKVKTTISQRLEFTGKPGPSQSVRLTTDSYKTEADRDDLLPMTGIDAAMKGFSVVMTIRPTGEAISVSPDARGSTNSVAENALSAQLATLQAIGPMGYALKNTPPAKGEKWNVKVDLTDAVRQSTADYMTPKEAVAEYTFTYVGDTVIDNVAVHHLKRIGTGRVKQKINVEGMEESESITTMTTDGDIYIDAKTGLLVRLESKDLANIDFGVMKMKQKSTTVVTGSRAN